jgi:N-acetylglucosaminyldiphosphoundecaprenol N-acetyl-beta-D-mannosaminyltransferase
MNIINKLILDENHIIDLFLSKLKNNQDLLLTYFNVNCFNIYHENVAYQNILENNFIVYPDGTGIWMLLYKLRKKYNRFNATDLNYKLISLVIKNKIPIVIISGNYDDKLVNQLCYNNKIKLIKYINGFLTDENILEEVRELTFGCIFIGVGVPRQELLAVRLKEKHPSSVIICVGNFFNFYFNFQKRAPIIFQKFGLEWFFRLILEPKRLFYRYTFGNFKFLLKAFLLNKDEI